MTNPFIDIIVPVWNQPFETRACLVSVLQGFDETARLVIVNNGCNRETELLLEEFAEPLGERVLYLCMERNVGFVPAVNRALSRSCADWSLILRPTSQLKHGWLPALRSATTTPETGIVTPLCSGELPLPSQLAAKSPCAHLETCELSFAGLLLSRTMRERIGCFDEALDSDRWCLRDYQQRAAAAGFLTILTPAAALTSGANQVYGSDERRKALLEHSTATCLARWGATERHAVYLPKECDDAQLQATLQTLLAAARRGNRCTLLLHRRQYQLAAEHGWLCRHTGLELVGLGRLAPQRDLRRRITQLQASHPGITIITGMPGMPVPGCDTPLPLSHITSLAKEIAPCRP